MSEVNNTRWVDVNYIQQHYLPISKKAIRKMLKENFDISRTGKKFLLEQSAFRHFNSPNPSFLRGIRGFFLCHFDS